MNYGDEDKRIEELMFDKKIRAFMKREGWDKLNEEELAEKVSDALNLLVKVGLVEQLIGEDGEFYYRSSGE